MWYRIDSTSRGGEYCRDEQEEGGQGVHVVRVVFEDMRTLSFIRKLSETLAETLQWVLFFQDAKKVTQGKIRTSDVLKFDGVRR